MPRFVLFTFMKLAKNSFVSNTKGPNTLAKT